MFLSLGTPTLAAKSVRSAADKDSNFCLKISLFRVP